MLCSRLDKRLARKFEIGCSAKHQPKIRMCEACLRQQLGDCRELQKEFYWQWRKLKDKIVKQNKRRKHAKKKGNTKKDNGQYQETTARKSRYRTWR